VEQELPELARDLVTTCARMIRWIPTEELPLSLAATRLLARLDENGPSRVSDLAEKERSSQPTITNHIKRLEAQGLVARTADPDDRRAWRIAVTPRGQDQLSNARQVMADNITPDLAQLTSADRAALVKGIAAMHKLMAL
jgi:DNA-binding MarR family transcriptional regulator